MALSDLNIKCKRVLLRVDFNVPLDDNFEVQDDTRIRRALPTINHLLEGGASVVLISHLGRPKGISPEFSLKHVVGKLEELLGQSVKFAADCVGEEGVFPDAEVVESRGSKEGRCFTTASGEEVPNRGQKVVPVVTEEGCPKMMTWQMANVHKSLTSVGKVCDQDNVCMVGKKGGFIRNNATG